MEKCVTSSGKTLEKNWWPKIGPEIKVFVIFLR